MPIIYNEGNRTIHLKNNMVSYVIGIEEDKYLTHRYWGEALPSYYGSNEIQRIDRGFATNPFPEDRTFSLNALPLETSTQGNGDHRVPNFQIRSNSGNNVTDFRYHSYKTGTIKSPLPGLPGLRQNGARVSTLEVLLVDTIQNLEMTLLYSLFEDYPIITRSVMYKNNGLEHVFLENAGSMMVDLPRSDFDMLTLNGSHTKEANISRVPLHPGIQKLESSRGTSSPQHQPFIALLDNHTSEFSGEVYSFHFIYSGNFLAQVEVEQYGSSRVQIGINPDNFEWVLSPSQSFYAPEVVLSFSKEGLNGMSQTYHQIYQNHLVPPIFAEKERPILLNTWEANYFNLQETGILRQADRASELGVELFVIDDGWFGQRNSDETSLGDWYADTTKLPQGISGIADEIHKRGMLFGLWFEPEMVSKNSDLYRENPDWVLHVPGYPLTEGRRQLVLDLSRPEVQDFIIQSISTYLETGKIDYIKWDMNRHLTEVGNAILPSNQQKELGHRYVLGLYHILEELITRFPNCLFENCSSGGGRFDPGMMYYMPQTWASDNTDALSRSIIQYGFSYLYPPIMIGSHVSPVPNHQVGRVTPLQTRGWIAMSGNLGYEIDLLSLPNEEVRQIKEQIEFYKNHKSLFQFGEFYRLQEPNHYFATSWLFKNNEEAILIYFNGLAQPAVPVTYLKTRYLDDDSLYQDRSTNQIYSGAELNQAGVTIPRIKEDFSALLFHWKKLT